MTSLYQIEVYMNKIVSMCMNDLEETIIIRIKDSVCVQAINIDYHHRCHTLESTLTTARHRLLSWDSARTRTAQLFFAVTALSCYSEKELSCSGPS